MSEVLSTPCAWYERGLDLALRWRLATASTFLCDAGAFGLSVRSIPKGFFPSRTVGLITPRRRAGKDISSRHEAAAWRTRKIVMDRPWTSTGGKAPIGGSGRAGNTATCHHAEIANERKVPARRSSRACVQLDKVEGARLS